MEVGGGGGWTSSILMVTLDLCQRPTAGVYASTACPISHTDYIHTGRTLVQLYQLPGTTPRRIPTGTITHDKCLPRFPFLSLRHSHLDEWCRIRHHDFPHQPGGIRSSDTTTRYYVVLESPTIEQQQVLITRGTGAGVVGIARSRLIHFFGNVRVYSSPSAVL